MRQQQIMARETLLDPLLTVNHPAALSPNYELYLTPQASFKKACKMNFESQTYRNLSKL